MTSILTKDPQIREDNMIPEAETGIRQPQVKNSQQPPKAGRGKEQNLP